CIMAFTTERVLRRLDGNMTNGSFRTTCQARVSFVPCALLLLLWWAGCAAPGNPREIATVPVYYATTRAVAANATTPEKGFAAASAEPQPVRYGRALVQVTTAGLHIVSYDP